MAHAVIILPKAALDIRRAASWITRHVSAESARRWHTRISNAIDSLSQRPERCPEADEAVDLGFDLRVLLSGRKPHVYRILFTIDDQSLNVLRILHAARDRVQSDDL